MHLAYYLGSIISDNGRLTLNVYELYESASRAMYNLLGNVNKHMPGNVYILTELLGKMILPIPTYNREVWGTSFFQKNSQLQIFYQKNNAKIL